MSYRFVTSIVIIRTLIRSAISTYLTIFLSNFQYSPMKFSTVNPRFSPRGLIVNFEIRHEDLFEGRRLIKKQEQARNPKATGLSRTVGEAEWWAISWYQASST